MATGNDVVIKAELLTKRFEDGIKRMDDAVDKLERKGRGVGNGFKRGFDKIRLAAMASAAAIGTAIGLSIREFQKFELGLAGVQKVADFSASELKEFEGQIDQLSRTIPISTQELFNAAEAAAVLGIRGSDNLTKFAETMGRLGVATDVGGEEAAKSISRIIQLSGESIDTIDRFGSALVELGNNFKASEAEILSNATRIRQSIAAYDVASTEILALATAAREAGVQSELAGTSIGRAIRTMDLAIAEGGEDLRTLSEIMGMTEKQIKETFDKSPVLAFKKFVAGLKSTKRSTADSARLLRALGLNGERLMAVLPSLAKISERLGDAMNTASKAYEENNALLDESNAFFETAQKQQELFVNQLRSFSKEIGRQFVPQWTKLLKVSGQFLEGINNEENAASLAKIATGVLAVAGGVIGIHALAGAFTAVTSAAILTKNAFVAMKGVRMIFWVGELTIALVRRLIPALTLTNFTLSVALAKFTAVIAAVALLDAGVKKLFDMMAKRSEEAADQESKRIMNLADQRVKEKQAWSEKKAFLPGFSPERDIADAKKKNERLAKLRKEDSDARAAEAERQRQEKEEADRLMAEKQQTQDAMDLEQFRMKMTGFYELRKKRDDRVAESIKDIADLEGETLSLQTQKDLKLVKKYERLKRAEEMQSLNNKFSMTATTLNNIAELTKGKSKEAFEVAKAASIASIISSTAAAVMKSHAQVPWPANWLEVAAIISTGAVQLATVSSQQPGFQSGGIVQRGRGTPAFGDRQVAYLEPGELVTPRQSAQDLIDLQARQQGYNNRDEDDEQQSMGRQEVLIGFQEDISDYIFAERRKNMSLGIGVT